MAETTHQLDTRERILAAASVCFTRDGLHVTTMEDIAREAGITRMTLYRHVASRDELILTLVLHDWQELAAGLRAVLDAETEARARVVEGTVYVTAQIAGRPYLLELLRSGGFGKWIATAEDDLLVDTFGAVITPYLEMHASELRASVVDSMEWLLRQVLLLLTARPNRGLTPAEIRHQTETFIAPSVLRCD